ncbi:MAG TPA: TlpA disulfide reductase family protein [Blastocatellia bacterium]|jgi:thiol-disulfide isomerase/thioredoxin|nr:TlpA disulfide reductase family protein [Blastocatellia bacterium]
MLSKLKDFRTVISMVVLAACLSLTASAQDLTFVTPDGQTRALSGERGKVVVLLFGGVQDPQCRDEFKALQSLSERYRGKDVSIYWVSVDSSGIVPDSRLTNPCGAAGSVVVLRDQNRAGFKRYSGRVAQLPTVVVLNQQGELQGQPRGGFNPNSDFINDLANVIDGLLGQK